MSKVSAHLDCGCAILEGGGRAWCPTCLDGVGKTPVERVIHASCSPACPVRMLAHEVIRDFLAYDESEWGSTAKPMIRLRDALAAPCGPTALPERGYSPVTSGSRLPKAPIGGTGQSTAQRPEEWARDCLAMIREDLEAYGMNMMGCPPMMYNDALRSLVARLGRLAGLTTTEQVREVVQAAERRAAPGND